MANRLRFIFLLALALSVAVVYLGCSSSTSSSGDDDSADDDDNDDHSPADDDDDSSPVPPQFTWTMESVVDSGYICTDNSLSGSQTRCHALAFTPTNSPVVAFYDDADGGGLKVAYQAADKAWTTDAVETATQTGRDPSVAVDKNGRIGVAYYNVSTKSVMCAFKPAGQAWTITTVAANVGGLFGVGGWPTLKFDANNVANIVGFNGFSQSILYFTEVAGGTWTTTEIFKQLADYKAPDFEFDSKGKPGMAWQVQQNNYTQEVTFYGTYDLATTAKHEQVNMTDITGTVNNYFAFVYDATDVPHIFYNSLSGAMQVIMAVNTSGTTWTKTTVPDNSQQLNGPIEARLGSDGAVWVSYACDYPLTPRLGRFADGGWTLYDVADNTQNQFGKRPALSVDSTGLPGVVYMYEPDALHGQLLYAKASLKQ